MSTRKLTEAKALGAKAPADERQHTLLIGGYCTRCGCEQARPCCPGCQLGAGEVCTACQTKGGAR